MDMPIRDRANSYDGASEGQDGESLLAGYSFRVCESAAEQADALEVRRKVYVDSSGYRVPVPDEYDERSWFLVAHHVSSGEPIGSLRMTPRAAGTLEAEEYFSLPPHLRAPGAVEVSRLAILAQYRKSRTFVPAVSFGLFKLVIEFAEFVDTDFLVICSKPERIWTFDWLCFQRTNLVARYTKLAGAEHELLWHDFRQVRQLFAAHPFRDLLVGGSSPEVVLPAQAPPLVGQLWPPRSLVRVTA